MHGISSLPREIVAEIFLLCLPVTKYIRPHPSTAPILLTHVCSSWRAFVSDFPNLWTSIHLTDKREGRGSPYLDEPEAISLNRMLLHQAELWNHRSRAQLASVSLELLYHQSFRSSESLNGKEINTNFWHPLVRCVVNKNLQTIRHLFICFNWGDHGVPFYNLPSLEIPNLESLHFTVTLGGTFPHHHSYSAPLENNATLPIIFSQAPSLRRVIIEVPLEPYKKNQLPWAQLTHLIVLSMISPDFFNFVIQECSSLERLSLNIDNLDPLANSSALASKMPIKMKYLHDLALTHRDIYDPSFIANITFPVLEKFLFFCSGTLAPPSFSWEPLTPDHLVMLNQLGNLHTLLLGNHEMSSEILLEILRFTPQLIELAVDADLGTYCRFLKGLTYQSDPEEGHQNILDCLEKFSLYIQTTGDGRLQPRISDDFPLIFNDFLAMTLSRSASKSFPRGTDEEQATFREGKSVRATLRKVLLRVEETEDARQATDIDEFHAHCQIYPQLRPPHMVFEVICKVDRPRWLWEEIDTW